MITISGPSKRQLASGPATGDRLLLEDQHNNSKKRELGVPINHQDQGDPGGLRLRVGGGMTPIDRPTEHSEYWVTGSIDINKNQPRSICIKTRMLEDVRPGSADD